MSEDQIYDLLTELASIDTSDTNLRDHPKAYEAVERALGTNSQRKPLTLDEVDELIAQYIDPIATYGGLHRFAKAIQAAHGIK